MLTFYKKQDTLFIESQHNKMYDNITRKGNTKHAIRKTT